MFEEKKIIGAAEISRTESGIFVVKNKIYEVLNNHIDWLKKQIYIN